MCFAPQVLVPSNPGGYACLVNGASVDDSNNGATSAECDSVGGDWTAYDCQTAYDFLQTQTGKANKIHNYLCCSHFSF